MLTIIDRLAGKWLDWRTDMEVRQNKELQELGIKEVSYKDGETGITISGQAVAILADHAAQFLDENNAKNYVQFDMMPRLDRNLKPVRVTVQWASGMSPSQMVFDVKGKLNDLVSRAQTLVDAIHSGESDSIVMLVEMVELTIDNSKGVQDE